MRVYVSKHKTTILCGYNSTKSTCCLGRHKCNCQASKHGLINNCLNCGRIVCKQEGSGPCVVCGELVRTFCRLI